jgi:hypothetical protein
MKNTNQIASPTRFGEAIWLFSTKKSILAAANNKIQLDILIVKCKSLK